MYGCDFQRIKNPSSLKGYLSLLNNKEKALPASHKVYPRKVALEVSELLYRRRKTNHEEGSLLKFETITKIQTERFSGKVFNLNTLSNIYFANNFLVHNCGKPTVVGDVGGFKENVLEGVTGVHVEGNNPESIASGLETAYLNRKAWGKNARKLTEEFFSWDKIIDSYVEELYRR